MKLIILLAVVLAPAAAFAQVAPPSPDDLGAFAQALFGAISAKQWGLVIALGVMAAVFAVRKIAAGLSPALDRFLHSDPGGVLLALAVSFATALAAASAIPGAVFGGAMLLAAFKTALVAMGGFALLAKLIAPLVQWLTAKLRPSTS